MTQTEVIEYGPVVTPPEVEAFLDKIEYLAKGARFLLLAGSLPRKMEEDFYAESCSACAGSAGTSVLDSAACRCAWASRAARTSWRPTCARRRTWSVTSSTTTRTSWTPRP